MGIRLKLPAGPGGRVPAVVRLTVVGARAQTDAEGGAATLAALLNAHHYTHGLSMPAAGTPTNGTPAGRAPAPEPHGIDEVFRIEGDMAPLVPPSNLINDATAVGRAAAAALGVPQRVFGHVAGADARTGLAGELIRGLLGSAFQGPLRRLLGPALDDDDAITLFATFVSQVRAGGPLPTIRVGDQPYGVLPVTLLGLDDPDLPAGSFEARMVARLAALRQWWEQVTVPVVGHPGATGDPGANLIEVMRTDAVTASAGVRAALGPQLAAEAEAALGPARVATFDQARTDLDYALSALGLTTGPTDLGRMLLAPEVAPLTVALVRPEPTPGPDGDPVPPTPLQTPGQYLRLLGFTRHAIGDFGLAHLAGDTAADYTIPGERPHPLLFAIGRLAVLAAADQAARAVLQARGGLPAGVSDLWDRELPPAVKPAGPVTLLERLQWPSPDGPGTSIGFQLLAAPPPEADPLWYVLGLVRELARQDFPAALLDQVLRAELGLFWNRLDAWYTAWAMQRLNILRSTAPSGLHLGAYGVVHDLHPGPPRTAVPQAEVPAGHSGPVYDDGANAGYVHAPSTGHAVTAAVLRSAHLAHSANGHGEAFAIDLSSRRVRRALYLLDGVNQGQPLGALLGYRIERDLKAAPPHGPAAIALVRAAAPLVAGRLTASDGAAPGLVAADNVVDGLRLLQLAGFGTADSVTESALAAAVPVLSAAQRKAALAALLAGADVVDAAADLMLAESVYQLVRGNPVRSGAAGDAVGGTPVPPGEVDVARTVRTGTAVTHRLAVALPPVTVADLEALGAASGWAVTARVRSAPAAEALARAVLPAPDRIRIRAGVPADDGPDEVIEVDLAALNAAAADAGRPALAVAALDVVLAVPDDGGGPATESGAADGGVAPTTALELRLAELVGIAEPAAAGTGLRLLLPRAADWTADDFGLVEALEIARSLRTLLGHARPLTPADLGRPQRPAVHRLRPDAVNTALVAARSTMDDLQLGIVTARTDLQSAVSAATDARGRVDWSVVDPTDLRTLLFEADGYGVPQAAPPPWPVDDATPVPSARRQADLADLYTRAAATATELARRIDAAVAEPAPPPGPDDPPDARDNHLAGTLRDRAEALFGRGYPVAADLAPAATGADRILTAAAAPAGADPPSIRLMLARTAQVRAGAARLAAVTAAADLARGTTGTATAAALIVGQLPEAPGERWVALDTPPGGEFPGGRISITAYLPRGGPHAGEVTGFLVDEWTEVVPGAAENTGIALHYDAPTSAAPNVVLLAVPRPGEEFWSAQAARDCVAEALALARIRAVDPDRVPAPGQLFPALLSWELNPNHPGLDALGRTTPPAGVPVP